MSQPERLERSMLFVPGHERHKIEKAAQSAADIVCLDLEDAVPVSEKAGARAVVVRALRELDFGRRARMVRINGLDTGFAYRDLVEVVEAAGARLELIMLPKAAGAGEVDFVDRLLTQIEQQAQSRAGQPPIGIEAQIETARGFVYCREIAAASPRLEALIFGAGDYSASMQMPSADIGVFDEHDALYPGHRWHAAMHTIVACARAFGLRAVDSPYAAFRDTEGFENSCRIAQALGFDGKQCIHPAQLATANQVFAPSSAAAAQAERVLAAYEAAAASGRGAAALDGKMIDAANVRMATTIVNKARAAKECS